jgi:hypothetical protein
LNGLNSLRSDGEAAAHGIVFVWLPEMIASKSTGTAKELSTLVTRRFRESGGVDSATYFDDLAAKSLDIASGVLNSWTLSTF